MQIATRYGIARAVNQLQKSSRRVGYLRATEEVSNFYKALLFHDFRNRVARESLRRGFGKGSLTIGSELLFPVGLQRMPSVRVPGVFSYPFRRQDFRRFHLPPLDSLVRDETRGAVPKCHFSTRCPFQTDQNSLTLWLTTPSRLAGRFAKGARSGQLSNRVRMLPVPAFHILVPPRSDRS